MLMMYILDGESIYREDIRVRKSMDNSKNNDQEKLESPDEKSPLIPPFFTTQRGWRIVGVVSIIIAGIISVVQEKMFLG